MKTEKKFLITNLTTSSIFKKLSARKEPNNTTENQKISSLNLRYLLAVELPLLVLKELA